MKKILKTNYKKIIILALVILLFFVIVDLFRTFVQPFIQPYFFKTSNIERLSGISIPNDLSVVAMLEYVVDTEPTYTLGGIRGIRGIYAKFSIDEDFYESLKQNYRFDFNERDFQIIRNMRRERNFESFNIENVEEIKFIIRSTSIANIEIRGIWTKHSQSSKNIATVITKEKHEINNEFIYAHYLYILA